MDKRIEQLDVYLEYRQQLIEENHQMKQDIENMKTEIEESREFKKKYDELKKDVDIYKFLLHSIVTKLNVISQYEVKPDEPKHKISIKSKK